MKIVSKLIFSFLIITIAIGCSTGNKKFNTVNFQPLFDYTIDESENYSEYNILGPLFTATTSPKIEQKLLRPFFSDIKTENNLEREFEYLYPLGKYKRKEKVIKHRFIPIYSSEKVLKGDDKGKKNGMFLAAFWGTTREGENYGGLWPIYGNMKQRFGKDDISFILWPLYLKTETHNIKDITSPWPFFSRVSSKNGNKERGLKVWPLFGYRIKDGEYNKKFFLWPLIFHERSDLDTLLPRYVNAFYPFYVYDSYPNRKTISIIWPFFNYAANESENFKIIDFPWPILQYAKGNNKSTFKFFPLFGYRNNNHSKSRFFLWPLYTYRKDFTKKYERTTHRILLLSKIDNHDLKWSKKKKSQIQIWPLFNLEKQSNGYVSFNFPEILPVNFTSFRRNISPLLWLYNYTGFPNGDEESKFLWGIYSYKKNKHGKYRSLSFLVSYEDHEEDYSFSILKGLFEVGKSDNSSYIKLLYIPININSNKTSE